MSSTTELELLKMKAKKFCRYFSDLSTNPGWQDEWKEGYEIATTWLDCLNNDEQSAEVVATVVDRALQYAKNGGTGAIDMHMSIVQWKEWSETSHSPDK